MEKGAKTKSKHKASLGHVDEKGKALPEALRPKVQLPSQMNDPVAPPMEHHSPDLTKQQDVVLKKGPRSSKKISHC